MIDKHTLEVLGKGIALAAFVFSVSTYAYNLHISREKERYSQAMKLVASYTDDGIRSRENSLATRLLFYSPDGLDLNNPESYPDEIFGDIARETLFGFTGGGEAATAFLPDLLRIADFYAEVRFCGSSQICNAQILTSFFCPKATQFLTAHRRLLSFYETFSNSGDVTAGLLGFAETCESGIG